MGAESSRDRWLFSTRSTGGPRLKGHGWNVAWEILAVLEREGLPARVVAAGRAQELRRELEQRRASGELSDGFCDESLAELSFELPADLPGVRSIVVAAVPRPQSSAVFTSDGVQCELAIPPTYTAHHDVAALWLDWLASILEPAGYHAAAAPLPLKLLATRSGLAAYGRNNITYVPGLGSYFELVAAYTDVPVGADTWTDPPVLERCLRCRACVNHCPTSAIRIGRFLLDVERCLVFHNEKPSAVPFAEWIGPAAHHTVIGCMMCQWVCPENGPVRGWTEDRAVFSESETSALLEGLPVDALDPATIRKLEDVDILRFVDLLPRNLTAALGH